jgi:hypothetical protein
MFLKIIIYYLIPIIGDKTQTAYFKLLRLYFIDKMMGKNVNTENNSGKFKPRAEWFKISRR